MPGGYLELKEIERTDGVLLPDFIRDRILQGDGNGVGLTLLSNPLDSKGEDNRVYLQLLLHGVQLCSEPCDALGSVS